MGLGGGSEFRKAEAAEAAAVEVAARSWGRARVASSAI